MQENPLPPFSRFSLTYVQDRGENSDFAVPMYRIESNFNRDFGSVVTTREQIPANSHGSWLGLGHMPFGLEIEVRNLRLGAGCIQ